LAASDSVKKLQAALELDDPPVRVRTQPESGARERDCFAIVDAKVRAEGGQMRLGWAVWQHSNIFIEGEFHGVYEPGEGQSWIDLTPRAQDFPDILFIHDPAATYELATTFLIDNCRVPLLPDPRLQRAFDLLSERTDLLNRLPGVNLTAKDMPPDVVIAIHAYADEAYRLIAQVERSLQPKAPPAPGRNDPCHCGSGRKYKRCHGA
jgi:SEC-C motif